jgi:hypothetical protein
MVSIAIILTSFVEFHSFSLSLMPIQKFSAAFWFLLNFGNVSLVIQKVMAKDKKVNIEFFISNTIFFWNF